MTTLTRDEVMSKFSRDDRFAVNLLLEMFSRQTEDEQDAEATGHKNGIGFNGTDAGFLSSLAKQAITRRAEKAAGKCPAHWTDLSPRQMECLRKKMAKYAGQLTAITNAQVAAREEAGNWTLRGPVVLPGTVEWGNDEGLANEAEYAARQEDRSPWGDEVPAIKPMPLPDHLRHKVRVREEVAVSADPFLSATSALVACPGGFRFRTDKERWEDGGKQEFNAGVERWAKDREGNVTGGRPAAILVGDPFS